jgi:hypothetical protein
MFLAGYVMTDINQGEGDIITAEQSARGILEGKRFLVSLAAHK